MSSSHYKLYKQMLSQFTHLGNWGLEKLRNLPEERTELGLEFRCDSNLDGPVSKYHILFINICTGFLGI